MGESVNNNIPPVSAPDFSKEIGNSVGSYKLLSLLGEGGFGIVYLAEQQKPLRRQVALKVIKPGMDSKQVIARFESERQALALLNHPNIAHVFDAGTTESGRLYFVMELVKGIPITEYCDQQKLSIEERLKIFICVCEAVQYAHQKGIIHRDIKPSNILVSLQSGMPVPIIIDFGVAKAMSQPLTERTIFTEQGQLIGTPEYMSPEQANLTIQDIDIRSDIYSLGVLLYELLTGALPFTTKELRKAGFAEIQRVIRESEPPRPSARLSSLGEEATKIAEKRSTQIATLTKRMRSELEWIPLKAMRKEREHRYRTASELGDDIKNYLNGNPLTAGPESASYRFKKLVKRHKYATAILGLLFIVIFSFTFSGYLLAHMKQVQLENERARANLYASTQQFGFFIFLESWHEEINENAGLITLFLSSGTKEKIGASFLLDPRPLSEKEVNFRRKFNNETNWFADFIIGEQYLKSRDKGDKEKAIAAYKLSHEQIQQHSTNDTSPLDKLLFNLVMSRLYFLENVDGGKNN
jgi:serine/threonine protein kinase